MASHHAFALSMAVPEHACAGNPVPVSTFNVVPTRDSDITTVMLHSLPHNMRVTDLRDVLDSWGFAGKSDYMSLVMRSRRSGKAPSVRAQERVLKNIGYGFINFVDPEDCAAFLVRFSASGLGGVQPAQAQGFSACMAIAEQSIQRGTQCAEVLLTF
mmetsp:Transcript_15790/g.49703  ORF Transcript_15790/g.49703 Transcript_15790/m.49703 type:complete len:157 (+) Transcript_15790:107-577(+)